MFAFSITFLNLFDPLCDLPCWVGNDTTNFVLHFPTFPVKMTFCYLIIQLKTFFPLLENEWTHANFLFDAHIS